MSLLGLALLGRNNEPLYLCDCKRIIKARELEMAQGTGEPTLPASTDAATEDPLGIDSITTSGVLSASLGFEHRLMIHSALDQLEESIETTDVGLPVPIKRGEVGGFLGITSKFDDDTWTYGYITATNIKFILLVEASAKEAEIRNLFSDIHEYYVRYCLNPLREIKAEINSHQFDKNITQAVRLYDSKRQFH